VHIFLAVDSKGRIVAADPVRRVIKLYSQAVRIGEDRDFNRERLDA
jgi:hypothetical protein